MTLVRSSFWPSLLAAGLLHAVAAGWIATRQPPRLQPRRPPTTVRLSTRPPAAKPEPKPPEPVRPPPLVSNRSAAATRTPRAETLPTPAAPPPPGTPPPQPRRFAVSMDALVSAGQGGVAMPTTSGATAARGDPNAPASAAIGDNSPFAGRAADVTDLEQAPRLLRQPSKLDLRALYPEAARREGLEANVKVELLVDETGAVREVRVVEGGGAGFDAAARQLARMLSFSPGTRAGRPVAVRYAWTFKFRLDE
jgi:protein TonB